ncbi:glutathione S-transferase family protein [Rhizobium sp. L1K21]|nr:glutathione S-transferase family protein [Rhizobium sp. L1K21]MCO6186745.1 glutathione S-transferase family protein [Rhizobium sp. L1K21]
MKFYFGRGTVALASLIALEETGITYEPVRLDMAAGQQRSPDYLAINPKGRVPALVTDQGILTETPALLVYIAQLAPEKKLAPLDDAFAFARLQSFNSYLCSTVHVAHAHKLRGSRWADQESSFEDMRNRVAGNVTECFSLIESEMFIGPWVLGDQYSVADAYLFTVAGWLAGDGVDVNQFPAIADFVARMRARPAVAKAVALENA